MKTQKLGIVLILIGILIIIHHIYITGGRPFDPQDILNHEFFEAIFITAGLILLINPHFNKKDN